MREVLDRIRSLPPVTTALVVCNVAVFLILEILGSTTDSALMFRYGALYAPAVLENGEYYRLLTSVFLHFGSVHLMNNMLLLFVAGMRLERAAGHVRFLILYLACGLAASAFTVILYTAMGDHALSAGASGAIFGILGALFAFALRGRGKVEDLYGRRLLFLLVLLVYSGFVSAETNNVAHLSGAAAGFLLGLLLYVKRS